MRTTRSLAVLAGTATSLVLLASPALAHVTAHSYDAVSGGSDAEISFRVPNEESALKTTKVVVQFPTATPLIGVMPEPKPGWSVAVVSAKLATPVKTDDGDISSAVSTITWTATAGGTPGGQYDDFDVAVGQMPEADSVVFKALQTYSDSSVVRWIEPTVAGQAEPEHPAPVLNLQPAAKTSDGASATPSVTASAAPATKTASSGSSDDSTAKALGGAGLGVAVVAALLALAALVRGRSAKG